MLPRIYDGSGQPAPERLTVQAGKLTADYEAGQLRSIRLGSTEIVRGIYAAVRDQNWGTIPSELRDVQMTVQADSFAISFTSHHQQHDIHYIWHGSITGTSDSTITFTFDGEARSSFKRNRIGFCVLHPMDVAGKAVAVEHVSGSVEQGAFPVFIKPHQPYYDLRALTHEVIPGVQAEVRMEGEIFEMEDQRNWTDASFKTYCTPHDLPLPVLVQTGEKVSQSITVRLLGAAANIEVVNPAPLLHLNPAAFAQLPPIGLASEAYDEPLSAPEIARLQALNLQHIRFDLHFANGWQAQLQRVRAELEQIAPQLELVVHFSAGVAFQAELEAFRAYLEQHPLKGNLVVFRDGEKVTRPETYATAVAALPHPHIGLGTNGYFTELNRERPAANLDALIVYPVNPQVHAFDNATMIENLSGLAQTVATAFEFLGADTSLHVGPVTLKIRWNPDAIAPDAPPLPGHLPRRVDPRQASLFGAGWTVGAIAALGLAGVHSLTFYELVGWLGVMERAGGSPLPDRFPSIPSSVFPMYHIFADVGDFVGGRVLDFASSYPLKFNGLALEHGARRRLLVANHTQERQTVTITGISGEWLLKSLDEHSADSAMRDPEGYRAVPGETVTAGTDGLTLDLLPYAVARLDQNSATL